MSFASKNLTQGRFPRLESRELRLASLNVEGVMLGCLFLL